MATPVSEAGRELPMAKVAPAFRTVPADVREPSDFIGNCAGQGERRAHTSGTPPCRMIHTRWNLPYTRPAKRAFVMGGYGNGSFSRAGNNCCFRPSFAVQSPDPCNGG